MVDQRWEEVLARPGALPALPEVLIRLRAGLYDLNIDIDQLCGELQCDAALVAEIIKTINSPLFGVPRRINSLKQAVVMLGLRRVRAIILSQSLRQSLATYHSPGFSLFNWWDRSLLTAVGAASLCQRAAPDLAEEAYLAGLVLDLGVLVLARFEPAYEAILRASAGASSEDLCKSEMEKLTVTHPALAGGVFTFWRFPAVVVEAVRRHHDPSIVEDTGAFFLPRVGYFAALLTDSVVTERADLCERLAAVAAGQMFMSPGELADFVESCLQRYRAVAVSMGHGALADRGVPPALARPA